MFSETPQRNPDFEFFGDFMLDGAAKFDDLAMFYMLELTECGDCAQLYEFIAQKRGGKLVVGDTVLWSEMVWTVAELHDGEISWVGVRPVSPADIS